MSRSQQDKVLKAIETAATDYGFEVVKNGGYANTGTISIEAPDGFDSILRFYYRFNEPYYQIDNIIPVLAGLKQPEAGKPQDVSVWVDGHGGTTSEMVIKAIRDHLATVKQAALEKEGIA